jgi:hypothetical protein
MTRIAWASGLALALISSEAAAKIVAYEITGTLQKDAISDPLFGAATEPPSFEIRFEADTSLAVPIPARTATSLPNAPKIAFAEDAFFLPSSAVKSFSFRLNSGAARFSKADLITDPTIPGVILVTGTFDHPSAVNLLLANSQSGYFQIGLPQCPSTCGLQGGLVLDQAGPFGTIKDSVIKVATP